MFTKYVWFKLADWEVLQEHNIIRQLFQDFVLLFLSSYNIKGDRYIGFMYFSKKVHKIVNEQVQGFF